jgi:uncharacterized protein YjdB
VPKGAPDYFWAVRDANQDLEGKNFLDLSTQGHWSSSDPAVATIDNTGTAATHKEGTTTITFQSGPFASSTLLTVGPAVISFITVTPSFPTVSLPAGTQAFTAKATYTDGAVVDVTNSAVWTSDDTNKVTVAGNIATGVAIGSTYVNATYQGVLGYTGINSGMTCLALDPTNPSAVAGDFVGFTATGYFGPGKCSDPTFGDVSAFVNWSSSNTTVADVDRFGFANALSAGTATITAASSPLTVSTTMTVTPPTLDSLAIQPDADVNIPEGATQQYLAIGTYSDFSTQDLTGSVTWNSDTPTIASISSQSVNSGLARANNSMTGSAQIWATIAGCGGTCSTDFVTLNVTPPVLQSITVTPASPSIAAGNTQQFSAQGNYSNGSTANITGLVTWMSSDTSVATVNTAGRAFTLEAGSATITATSGSITGAANLTVTPAALVSVAVTPSTLQTINTGQTQQYTATGTYSDTSTRDITNSVTWQSDNTGVATIDSAGLASGVATSNGTAHIHATDPATTVASPQVQLNVNAVVLTSIAVTPGTPNVTLGSTQQFTAIGTFSDNSTQDITGSVTWGSDNTAVSRLCDVGTACTPKGEAQTFAAGSAHVTASKSSSGCGGGVCASPSSTLTVNSATLQSITIAPLHSFVVVGQNKQFTATGHYSDGSTRPLTTLVSWASSKPSVASITNSGNNPGLVTGNAVGTCTITATINVDGVHSASTDVTVTLF